MNAIAEKPLPASVDTQTSDILPQPRRRLRGLWRPAVGLAAAVGIGVTASWWFTEGRYIESTDNT